MEVRTSEAMRVALAITGGVAAYKAAELVRQLQQDGLEVQVVMTDAACEFVRPLTFAALTGRKVITGLFGEQGGAGANIESAIEHIAVAQRIDLLVVAPATADALAKFANGAGGDFLSTLYLATRAPVIVAPAMNGNMWEHQATRTNVQVLRERGVHVVEPDEGYLACGMTGAGRLAATTTIARKVREVLGLRHDLEGESVLVTAGPTRELIDPVRYLTNRSSGKMGYAVAEAACRRGARVVLVSGPVNLFPPERAEWIPVQTAEDMQLAVESRSAEATIIVMAAAVADYRPVAPQDLKIKRGTGRLTIELEPNPDILASLGREKGTRVLVGFAAETDHLAENAKQKLESKGADMIVGNDVSKAGAGFDVDTNVATFFFRDGREDALPQMTKQELADRILDGALDLRKAGSRAGHGAR
jgi:phosphopantothenoylcysteine decarboxylase/phosphopantothenate--cysteine ligase